MELIERYLQAVGFWLPRQQKHDIIAELSADIHAQIEEREAGLGRKLTEAEVETVLKQRGHPLLVANRFLPQEHLIGPGLFPVYRFVLKIVALCYLIPWLLVWGGLMTFSPVYRAQQTSSSWFAAIASMWGSFFGTAFVVVGVLTIAFAVLERMQNRLHFFDRWNPSKLPPVRKPNLIPRGSSSVELAVNLLFIVWWAAYLHSPLVRIGSTVEISLNPQWIWFFWSYLLLALANAAFAAANLMHPFWTPSRAAFRLLSDALGAALFCWLLKATILAGIAIPNVASDKAAAITHAVNYWMATLFPAGIVVGLVLVAINVYRIVRLQSETEPVSA
ncbi:MAG: hypothetical protein ABSE99_09235 [Terracidiphilus sp.]|jgi:hypothetical protein